MSGFDEDPQFEIISMPGENLDDQDEFDAPSGVEDDQKDSTEES